MSALEFLLSLAVLLAVLQTLAAGERGFAGRLFESMEDAGLKMRAESLAASLNTHYLNRGNIRADESLLGAGFEALNGTILLREGNRSASASCLSPEITKSGATIDPGGVRRWFPQVSHS